MIAEKYLQSIREMKDEIEYLKEVRDDISGDIGYMSSSSPSTGRVQCSNKDGLEMMVIKRRKRLGRLEKKIHDKILDYNAKRVKIIVLIHRLPDDQRRQFLIDYYLEGKDLDELADEYHHENTKSIYSLKKRAVRLFEKRFEKDIQGFDKDVLQKLKKTEKNISDNSAQALELSGVEGN